MTDSDADLHGGRGRRTEAGRGARPGRADGDPGTGSGPPDPPRSPGTRPAGRFGAFLELTKPRITALVVASAVAAYLAAAGGDASVHRLAGLLLGTALAAGGTNALNQWWERDLDARMERTRGRPLPAGRLAPGPALAFGAAAAAAGVALLAASTALLTALLAAATVVVYVTVYTPLKRKSALSTYVGAVPGALPVLGGWAAHGQGLSEAGWGLFGLLALWQLPHFFALEWQNRDDYRRAGFRTLAVTDPSGRRSSRQAFVCTLLLAPTSLVPLADPGLGWLYGGAAAVGIALLAVPSAGFLLRPRERWAGRLFGASLLYLPLVLATAVLDAVV